MSRFRAAALALAVVAGAAGGCGGDPDPAGTSVRPTGTLTVLAAASLTEAFTRLGTEFEAAHPGTRVTFSFGGSSRLAQQITAGAPADVFAAASPATMRVVTDREPGSGRPITFARNQLVIAVPAGNPERLTGLADLTRPGLKVALCAPQVPCGAAARTALDAAGIAVAPVTLDQDVRAALSRVKLGEVDAALVYGTDVRSAVGEVDPVEFPESAGAVNDYPILALPGAPNPAGAAAFVAYLLSPAGRTALADAGFQTP